MKKLYTLAFAFIALHMSAYEISSPGTAPGGWRDYGTATFTDGWILPSQSLDPEAYKWEVNVQQNTENANIYRLVSPYMQSGCPLPSYMTSTPGYIQFDVTDPDCVTVSTGVFCGYANGTSYFYNFNEEGFLASQGMTTAEIKAQLGADYNYSTLRGNVLDIPDCALSLDPECPKALHWTDPLEASRMKARMEFTRTMTGVEDIADEAVPAEYYTLQGVRVAEPQPGQMVICRRGATVTKEIR